jgi:hypothetical protein
LAGSKTEKCFGLEAYILLEVLQEGGDTDWHRLVVVNISRKEVYGSTDWGGSSNVAMLIFTE